MRSVRVPRPHHASRSRMHWYKVASSAVVCDRGSVSGLMIRSRVGIEVVAAERSEPPTAGVRLGQGSRCDCLQRLAVQAHDLDLVQASGVQAPVEPQRGFVGV